MSLLKVENLSKRFGGLTAVNQLDFELNSHGVFSIIGPNGAGKSTVFNLISGIYKPSQGKIMFKNDGIQSKKPFQIAKLGISRTFQNIRLFKMASVWENVAIGQNINFSTQLISTIFKSKKFIQNELKIKEKTEELLNFVGLEKHWYTKANSLSYGEQRRLEIARALATEPSLLLLDEPAAGMNHSETDELVTLINKIKDLDITILLIEHDMSLVMSISDYIIVMNFGSKIAEGNALEIRNHPEVIKAYLGTTE